MCDYYQLSEQGLTGFGGFTRSGIYGDDKIPEHLVPAVVEAFRASTGVTLLVTRIPHLKGEPFCLFYPKEMPEPQRANWRMVMRGILMGLPVLPPKPPIRAIKGTMHSDDYVFECEFDATSWFEQASPEEIVEHGINAGVDILLEYGSFDVLKLIDEVHTMVESGDIDPEIIDEGVRRVLRLKYKFGLL